MESKNPFSRSRKERKLIDAGIYQAKLVVVKTVEVADKKNPGEKVTKIIFTFGIPDNGAEVTQFFTPSLADASHIVRFLKTACGSAFTPAIQADPEAMWKFVNGLVGSDFTIVVTESNGWNNVQSAMAAKKKTEAKSDSPFPVASSEELFTFSDDQIPF